MDDLVRKAKQGDKQAFTELILAIKTDLYKIAKARLRNDEDVYDVIQETKVLHICLQQTKAEEKIQVLKDY